MTIEELNSPDWSDKVLLLDDEDRLEAIKNKIFYGRIDQDAITLSSLVWHAKLYRILLGCEDMTEHICALLKKEAKTTAAFEVRPSGPES